MLHSGDFLIEGTRVTAALARWLLPIRVAAPGSGPAIVRSWQPT